MNWRAQPLDFMSLTQLAMIADDPHDSRRDEARQRVYRAMARNERLPMATTRSGDEYHKLQNWGD